MFDSAQGSESRFADEGRAKQTHRLPALESSQAAFDSLEPAGGPHPPSCDVCSRLDFVAPRYVRTTVPVTQVADVVLAHLR